METHHMIGSAGWQRPLGLRKASSAQIVDDQGAGPDQHFEGARRDLQSALARHLQPQTEQVRRFSSISQSTSLSWSYS